MFKLSAEELSKYNFPTIHKLMQDTTRPFPPAVAFQLGDIMDAVQGKLKTYNKQVRAIIEGNGGTINSETGKVTYAEPVAENQAAADEGVEALNTAAIEIPGVPLERGEDWPNLTIAEARLLKPFMKGVKRSTPLKDKEE